MTISPILRSIQLVEWQAEKVAQLLAETGQITLIVQDNHPIHTSKKVREHWSAWQEKGLFLFQCFNCPSIHLR